MWQLSLRGRGAHSPLGTAWTPPSRGLPSRRPGTRSASEWPLALRLHRESGDRSQSQLCATCRWPSSLWATALCSLFSTPNESTGESEGTDEPGRPRGRFLGEVSGVQAGARPGAQQARGSPLHQRQARRVARSRGQTAWVPPQLCYCSPVISGLFNILEPQCLICKMVPTGADGTHNGVGRKERARACVVLGTVPGTPREMVAMGAAGSEPESRLSTG